MTITEKFGPSAREVAVGDVIYLCRDKPLVLDSGATISDFPVCYQMIGTPNADKSNLVLLCHGLTGDQYVIGTNPVTGRPGWWEILVGPGRTIDTDRYCVIASNALGGSMGTYGPKSINPRTGKPFGLDFPVFTIGDMVKVQAALLDALDIDSLLAVIGGSMGGMQALDWAARFPGRVHASVALATAARHSAQNIAFHEIGRQAIMADPEWCDGNYLEAGRYPSKGLSVARMTAHVTYLSEAALGRKFGRALQDKQSITYGFDADFQVESYLRYQGTAFVERFDPNSYLYITRAMDYFDLAASAEGNLAEVFRGSKTQFCIVSFSSDWLFPTSESRMIVRALNAVAANVSFSEIVTDKGHDAFLLDVPKLRSVLKGFLDRVAKERGVA